MMAIIVPIILFSLILFVLMVGLPRRRELAATAVREWCATKNLRLIGLEFKNRFNSPLTIPLSGILLSKYRMFIFVKAWISENGVERPLWILLEQRNLWPGEYLTRRPEVIETVWDNEVTPRHNRAQKIWHWSTVAWLSLLIMLIIAAVYLRFFSGLDLSA